MPRQSGWLLPLLLALLASVVPSAATAAGPSGDATAHRLVTGLEGGSGSTIGPDGALYVTESAAGRITRVDPRTGATTTYASGLPRLTPPSASVGRSTSRSWAGPRMCW
jgi:streptogramin lyase